MQLLYGGGFGGFRACLVHGFFMLILDIPVWKKAYSGKSTHFEVHLQYL